MIILFNLIFFIMEKVILGKFGKQAQISTINFKAHDKFFDIETKRHVLCLPLSEEGGKHRGYVLICTQIEHNLFYLTSEDNYHIVYDRYFQDRVFLDIDLFEGQSLDEFELRVQIFPKEAREFLEQNVFYDFLEIGDTGKYFLSTPEGYLGNEKTDQCYALRIFE
jgi:hypothetical protein